MTRPTLEIRQAGPADVDWVAALIGQAFHPLAVACWLVPDPVRRAQVLPAQFRILVAHGVAHGQVHVTTDRAAAAVWFPRDGEQLPEPEAYAQRLAAACGDTMWRFRHLDDLFDSHHPDQPHHHLAFLAVDPRRQGHGLGSALLDHHHSTLDTAGVAAYLEASSARNRDLYTRHGYQTRDSFELPDGTPMWPMWRPPQSRQRTEGE